MKWTMLIETKNPLATTQIYPTNWQQITKAGTNIQKQKGSNSYEIDQPSTDSFSEHWKHSKRLSVLPQSHKTFLPYI